MQKPILGVLLLSLLAGCSMSQRLPAASLPPEARSHTFNATGTTVYNATLAYLVRAGYQIDVSDKESGVISTGYKEFVNDSRIDWDDRQRLTALIVEEGRTKTRVTLTLTVEILYDDVWKARNLEKTKITALYKMHLQGIAQQAKNE